MRARVTEIPFDTRPPDPNLPVRQALLDDPDARSALLAWAVRGAVQWYANHQRVPLTEAVQRATDEYTREMDPFADWAADNLVFEDGAWTANAALVTNYTSWCEANGVNVSKNPSIALGRWLQAQEHVTTGNAARRNRKRGVLGVRIKQ